MRALALVLALAAGPALAHPGHDAPPPPNHMYDAVGVLQKWDAKKRAADIAYEYNERLGWPAMRMTFAVAPEVDMTALKPKSRVQFMLHQTPSGAMLVVQMCKTDAAAPVPGRCGPAPMMHAGHEGHEGHEGREDPGATEGGHAH